MAGRIYTIGHSTHSVGKLIELLAIHGINALGDVRSRPYSRINPQFNRESLGNDLKAAGIAYVFLGRELGARPEDRSCYIDGRVQYDLLARTPLFKEGLRRIAQGIDSHRIVLMCAERDPLMCHRTILICRHLAAEHGIGAHHIREDGRIESQEDTAIRLLAELDLSESDLFRDGEDLLTQAYFRRAEEIAYTERQLAAGENS